MQEKEFYKSKIDEHIRVAEGMRSLFLSRDKKGMWQSEVIDSLQQNPTGVFSSVQELRNVIVSISKILPEWLKIFDIPKGVFMRMEL